MAAMFWVRTTSMTEPTSFAYLRVLIEKCRDEHPNWFRLERDEPATPEQIGTVEAALGCRLPSSYVEFVSEFGGGDFAFTVIYSPSPESESSIIEANGQPWVNREGFVAFADTGTGDYFGWEVADGLAGDKVMLLDHTVEELRPCDYDDFFDFVIREGLRQ